MHTERPVYTALARAIAALDTASFCRKSEEDEMDIKAARKLLLEAIERAGYEIAAPLSPRIRKVKSE